MQNVTNKRCIVSPQRLTRTFTVCPAAPATFAKNRFVAPNAAVRFRNATWILAILVIATTSAACSAEPAVPSLELLATIELPQVRGRIDHMDVDVAGRRVFVGALENDSLEVVDLAAGKDIRSIHGLGGPQGVSFVPRTGAVYISARDTGNLVILDGLSFSEIKRIPFGNEADNMHLLPASERVILGYGSGGVAVLDARTNVLIGTVAVNGHPEGVQADESANIVYANVPGTNAVYLIDLQTLKVRSTWPSTGPLSNFPLALDAEKKRVAYYTHVPSQITILDADSGKILVQRPSPGDVDDMFFDPGSHNLYLVAGEGRVEVWSFGPGNTVIPVAKTATGPGARTGLLCPALHMLFVAAPARGNTPARLLVFRSL